MYDTESVWTFSFWQAQIDIAQYKAGGNDGPMSSTHSLYKPLIIELRLSLPLRLHR
jgi:hypothetical protein